MAGPSHKKSYKQTHCLTELCLVCTAPAPVHSHYGAVSCYPCRAFFRRGISRAYVCISGHGKCTVNNITRSNCKKCRFERCLAVGMKLELVDTTVKRKERERRMRENNEDATEIAHEHVEGDVLVSPEEKMDEDIPRNSPAESIELDSQMNELVIVDSVKNTSQQPPQTFYIFDPRNNTYEPVVIVQSDENRMVVNIDNTAEQDARPVTEQDNQDISYGNATPASRVSVIKRLETCQFENPMISEANDILQLEEKSENSKDDCIDIEKIVEICFSEEIEQNQDCKTTGENNRQSIQEKRQRKLSTSVLPFKKRRIVHQFEFLSTAISKALIPAFTFEEEFRLHDLVVRRDSLNDETLRYALIKDPMITNAAMARVANGVYKKEKIQYTENEFEFFKTSFREFASLKWRDTFEEFKSLNKSLAVSCVHRSIPASFCLVMGIFDQNKHLGLKEQSTLMGQTGKTYKELWDKYFPDSEQLSGLGLNDFSILTSPWAQTFDDEQFFTETATTVGKLLGSDLQLCVVYFILLMSSQPKDSPLVGNCQLSKLQLDLGLLLYRYLTTKLGRDEAAKQAHSLIGMLESLHRCGDIVMNRRIRMLPEDA